MQYIHASSGFTCSKWQVIISICNMLLNVQFFCTYNLSYLAKLGTQLFCRIKKSVNFGVW